jgi:hypothetical protein
MRNYWLDRYQVGKRVRYVGLQTDLWGKFGRIVKNLKDGNVEVEFEFLGMFTTTRNVIIKKTEIIVL